MHEGLQKKILLAHGVHGDVRRTYWVNPEEKSARNLRFSSGERKVAREVGVPPADRIKISYGMIFSKDANRGVDTAVAAIGKVHTVPKDLYRVPIKVTGHLGGASGLYKIWQPFGGNEINVSKYTQHPAGVAAHEYGHFLDHHLFGTGKPEIRGLATMRRAPEVAGVMNAIYKSDAMKKLAEKHVKLGDDGHYEQQRNTQYLMMPAELFARSYAQWVGLRAGGPVRSDTKAYGDYWARLGYRGAQWEDKDFEPIAREFDRLFQNRGLLRSGRRR